MACEVIYDMIRILFILAAGTILVVKGAFYGCLFLSLQMSLDVCHVKLMVTVFIMKFSLLLHPVSSLVCVLQTVSSYYLLI